MEGLSQYDYEVIFIDNSSEDGTQDALRRICSGNVKIKTILNISNFRRSGWYAMLQATGNAVIYIPADFQVPIELIPKMIIEWENGANVVALVKTSSEKDKIWLIRKLYYVMSNSLADQGALYGFTGSGLYDRTFIDMCKKCGDPLIRLHHMVARYAAPLKKIEYHENKRRSGKSKNNATSLIDAAIGRFISITTTIPRYMILTGMTIGVGSLMISIYYLIRKLIDWDNFPVGIAPLVIGVFFLGAIQLIFLGLMGEYILRIEERQKNEPIVIEKERINFNVINEVDEIID